jgi:hypothetical protein
VAFFFLLILQACTWTHYVFKKFQQLNIVFTVHLVYIKNQDQLDAQSLFKNFNSSITLNPTCFGQVPDHLQGYTTLKCVVHMLNTLTIFKTAFSDFLVTLKLCFEKLYIRLDLIVSHLTCVQHMDYAF